MHGASSVEAWCQKLPGPGTLVVQHSSSIQPAMWGIGLAIIFCQPGPSRSCCCLHPLLPCCRALCSQKGGMGEERAWSRSARLMQAWMPWQHSLPTLAQVTFTASVSSASQQHVCVCMNITAACKQMQHEPAFPNAVTCQSVHKLSIRCVLPPLCL